MIRIRMTFQVQVTGASNATAAAYNVLKDLLRYDDPKKLIRGTLSESPCAMDNVMDYSQITNFINSPFGAYADSVFSRNAFDIIYISNPTLPGTTGGNPSTGLANINQLVVNITIDQQALSRVFRHARNDPVTWPNAPTINITVL